MIKLVAVVIIVLAGCGYSHEQEKTVKSDVIVYGLESGYYAREFRLSDGTRCVAFSSHGITCSWNK